MRFFSKFVALLNLCFLITVTMRYYMAQFASKSKSNGVLISQPIESTISVLGYLAIFVNIIFLVIFLVFYPSKKMNNIGKPVLYFNLLILPAQLYFHFFSK